MMMTFGKRHISSKFKNSKGSRELAGELWDWLGTKNQKAFWRVAARSVSGCGLSCLFCFCFDGC
jgi:hypothetical protein